MAIQRLDPAKVRSRRESLGISQETFAAQAGIGRYTMNKIENGAFVMGPSLAVARAVAGALGVPLETIAIGAPTPHHRPDRVTTTSSPESGGQAARRRPPTPNPKG